MSLYTPKVPPLQRWKSVQILVLKSPWIGIISGSGVVDFPLWWFLKGSTSIAKCRALCLLVRSLSSCLELMKGIHLLSISHHDIVLQARDTFAMTYTTGRDYGSFRNNPVVLTCKSGIKKSIGFESCLIHRHEIRLLAVRPHSAWAGTFSPPSRYNILGVPLQQRIQNQVKGWTHTSAQPMDQIPRRTMSRPLVRRLRNTVLSPGLRDLIDYFKVLRI